MARVRVLVVSEPWHAPNKAPDDPDNLFDHVAWPAEGENAEDAEARYRREIESTGGRVIKVIEREESELRATLRINPETQTITEK